MSGTAQSILSALNEEQREAVAAIEGPVLILAGAGSGKTRVITHRIAHLLLDHGVRPEQVLAVTFTNKAAGEMRERVQALLDEARLPLWVSTFHSFCVRLLRRNAAHAGLAPGFVIYDEADQLGAVKGALRSLDLSEKLHPPRRILSRISAAKNSGRDPGDEDDGSFASGVFALVARHYREALRAANAVDFDDLLLLTVSLLAGDSAARADWRGRFRYVLVDEYQDTNRSQFDIVRLLAGDGGNLTVVGDEDQSIYSWRGADIGNILDFERAFPGARVFRLERNYRSCQSILDVAGALVANNRRRKGKVLSAVREAGDPVRLFEAEDEYAEAQFVVERIKAAASRPTAVLFRTNAQSRLFEEGLLRHRIRYIVVGGVGFYERREVKDALAYLRLASNPADSAAFARVINVPLRGIGARTIAEIEKAAAEQKVSLFEAASSLVDSASFSGRAQVAVASFLELVERIRQAAASLGVRSVLELALTGSGYGSALADQEDQDGEARLENLKELLAATTEYEAREPEPTLLGFLDQVALLSDVDSFDGRAPVVLMTLHSAKGLEFENVFLVGLEEGLVPHFRSLENEGALEEERRLCYVGITRAMDRLFLSYARSRQVFGQRKPTTPSRFLDEISSERVERIGVRRHPEIGRLPLGESFTRASGTRRAKLVADDESPALRPGARVRHALFGAGTIVRCEGSGDDLKVTVSFGAAGTRKLVARYAGLEPQ